MCSGLSCIAEPSVNGRRYGKISLAVLSESPRFILCIPIGKRKSAVKHIAGKILQKKKKNFFELNLILVFAENCDFLAFAVLFFIANNYIVGSALLLH